MQLVDTDIEMFTTCICKWIISYLLYLLTILIDNSKYIWKYKNVEKKYTCHVVHETREGKITLKWDMYLLIVNQKNKHYTYLECSYTCILFTSNSLNTAVICLCNCSIKKYNRCTHRQSTYYSYMALTAIYTETPYIVSFIQ